MTQKIHHGKVPEGLTKTAITTKGFTWYRNSEGCLEGYKSTRPTKDVDLFGNRIFRECIRWVTNCKTEPELVEFTKSPPEVEKVRPLQRPESIKNRMTTQQRYLILESSRSVLRPYGIDFDTAVVTSSSCAGENVFHRALIVVCLLQLGYPHSLIDRALGKSYGASLALLDYGRPTAKTNPDLRARYRSIRASVESEMMSLNTEEKMDFKPTLLSLFGSERVVFKYVCASNRKYAAQSKRLQGIINDRLNALAALMNVDIRTAATIYINETKGMPQEDKMRWLSATINYDHISFSNEWDELMSIDKYHALSDADVIIGNTRIKTA